MVVQIGVIVAVFRKLLIVLCVVALSGCAVTPTPLESDQVEMIAYEDRELIFRDQETLSGPLGLEQAIAMSEGSIGRDHLDNLNRRLLIANALELRGDSEEAEQIRVSAESLRAGIMAEWNAAIAAETATP